MRSFKNSWFNRFARRHDIPDRVLQDAVRRAERGQVDADYGGGVVKQRIPRSGGGKSSGYRAIVLFWQGKAAFFVFGFAKSARANIAKDEEDAFKKLAKIMLVLDDASIAALVKDGQLIEVDDGEPV